MAVTVNVRWHEGTALFAIAGEVEPDTLELMSDALRVARTDADTIVIDVSEARLNDVELLALRRALDGAKVTLPVLVCGSDGNRQVIAEILGGRAVLVDSFDGLGHHPGKNGSDSQPQTT